jgi:anti-anti-sigma regulatory factor
LPQSSDIWDVRFGANTTEKVTVTENSSNDDITEEEFDALLDAIDGRTKTPSPDPEITVSETVAGATGNEEITEEEFDAVLDRLQAAKKIAAQGSPSLESATGSVMNEYLTDLCVEASSAEEIKLVANVGIAEAADLHTRLIALAAKRADVCIEAGSVESIDTAAMQLLYVFIKEIKSNGNAVAWSNPSAVVLRNARLLGLSEQLDLLGIDAQAA